MPSWVFGRILNTACALGNYPTPREKNLKILKETAWCSHNVRKGVHSQEQAGKTPKSQDNKSSERSCLRNEELAQIVKARMDRIKLFVNNSTVSLNISQ